MFAMPCINPPVGLVTVWCCKSRRESRKRWVWLALMRFFVRFPPLREPLRMRVTSLGIESDA
jgi:hypothetical protein